MTPEERRSSKTLVYQCLPSRYGFNPDDLRKADAIEIVVGQGAKPGGGGMLLGQKVSARVAAMRTLPEGIDQRSACRHPDWTGPDDLTIKLQELREITDWQVPIYVKMGATRVRDDVKLAVKAGADVVVIDGMQGGTAASQQVFIEHAGIPTLAALPLAVEALDEMNVLGEVQLVISGGIRTGADVAKALALGADAVSIGQGVLMALGCNRPDLPHARRPARRSGRLRGARHGSRLLPSLPHGPLSRRHHDARPDVGAAAHAGRGREAAAELFQRAHDGTDDAGPRLREVERAPPRAGRPGGPHHRGIRHGPRPAGGHKLDPRPRGPGRTLVTACERS